MNDGQQRIEEIFLAALELPEAGQRSTFLERHCAGDLALRAEVEQLLVFQAEADRFFLKVGSQLNQVLSSAP